MDIINDFKTEFQRKGWTQEKWAQETGIPQSTISRMLTHEGCDTRRRNLQKLLPFLYPSMTDEAQPHG